MNFEKPTNLKEEKDKEIQDMKRRVEKIEDKLGNPVDEGIKNTVVMFNICGFHTSQSCEGHPGEKHGTDFPWVQVGPEKPEKKEWKKDEQTRKIIKKKNKILKKNLIDLLNEFYKNRETSFGIMLSIDDMSYNFRVQSIAGEVMDIMSENDKKEKLKEMKGEMDDFTEFLKNKFLNGEI